MNLTKQDTHSKPETTISALVSRTATISSPIAADRAQRNTSEITRAALRRSRYTASLGSGKFVVGMGSEGLGVWFREEAAAYRR
jgi:hypothetical protein